jgi:hypothetical protein
VLLLPLLLLGRFNEDECRGEAKTALGRKMI